MAKKKIRKKKLAKKRKPKAKKMAVRKPKPRTAAARRIAEAISILQKAKIKSWAQYRRFLKNELGMVEQELRKIK